MNKYARPTYKVAYDGTKDKVAVVVYEDIELIVNNDLVTIEGYGYRCCLRKLTIENAIRKIESFAWLSKKSKKELIERIHQLSAIDKDEYKRIGIGREKLKAILKKNYSELHVMVVDRYKDGLECGNYTLIDDGVRAVLATMYVENPQAFKDVMDEGDRSLCLQDQLIACLNKVHVDIRKEMEILRALVIDEQKKAVKREVSWSI